MTIDVETITKITALLLAIATLLGAVTLLIRKGRVAWRTVGEPLWPGVLRPFLIISAAFAILLIPNGLFLQFLMRYAAIYYWIAGNQDLSINNDMAFVKFVAWQTVPVSIYSYLWAALIYPRFIRWLRGKKKESQQ